MTDRDRKPSGVWVAIEHVKFGPPHDRQPGIRFVGVFASFDLADTACGGLDHYAIANIEIGQCYRDAAVNWRVKVRARS